MADLPGAPAAPLNTGPRVGAMGAPPPLEAPKGPGGASSIGTAPAATAASQTLGKSAGVLTPWRDWQAFAHSNALARAAEHRGGDLAARLSGRRNDAFIQALKNSAPAALGVGVLAAGGALAQGAGSASREPELDIKTAAFRDARALLGL